MHTENNKLSLEKFFRIKIQGTLTTNDRILRKNDRGFDINRRMYIGHSV